MYTESRLRVVVVVLSLALSLGCAVPRVGDHRRLDVGQVLCDLCEGRALPTHTVNGWTHESGRVREVPGLTYDVFTPPPERETTAGALYYFHGLCDRGGLVASRFDRTALDTIFAGMRARRVVAVTFGEAWVLTPHDRKWHEGVEKYETAGVFVSKVIPHIERKHGLRGPRVGMGTSMGGLNLATLAMRYPRVFDRIVLMHPMIFDCDPYRDVRCRPGAVVRGAYSEEQWAQGNPHALLKRAATMPSTYVAACQSDAFHLYAGTEDWAQKARQRGFPVTFRPDDPGCRHGSPDPDPIIEFLNR